MCCIIPKKKAARGSWHRRRLKCFSKNTDSANSYRDEQARLSTWAARYPSSRTHQHAPTGRKNVEASLRKVVGLVLLIPLLLPLTPIPFGLGREASLAVVAGSIYGAWYASQHASRAVAIGAGTLALLNLASFLAVSMPSIVWFIFQVIWAYGSGNWIHWNFYRPQN
jgi:hypothetical protein